MPKYRLHEDVVDRNACLHKRGEVVDWDDEPSLAMEPLDAEGYAKSKELFRRVRDTEPPWPEPTTSYDAPPKPVLPLAEDESNPFAAPTPPAKEKK